MRWSIAITLLLALVATLGVGWQVTRLFADVYYIETRFEMTAPEDGCTIEELERVRLLVGEGSSGAGTGSGTCGGRHATRLERATRIHAIDAEHVVFDLRLDLEETLPGGFRQRL